MGITKKLSQGFSRIEWGILGDLSKLEGFILDSQLQTFSRTVPGTSRNNDLENLEQKGARSHGNLYTEVEFSIRRTSNSVDWAHEENSHTIVSRQKVTLITESSFMWNLSTSIWSCIIVLALQ